MYFWGAQFSNVYGPKPWNEREDKLQDSRWHKWEWVAGPELVFMMLDYYAYTGDEEFLKNKQGWSKWIKRRGSLEIEQIQLKFPYSYLSMTINLLKSRNIPFVFVYLPESGSNFQNPLRQDFYKQYGQVLTLPDSIVQSPTNWMDDMHFNDSGAGQVSEWMAKKLKQITKSIYMQ